MKNNKFLCGEITLNKTYVADKKVCFDYTLSKKLEIFFDKEYKFFYEYLFDFTFDNIPESILNVPFVMNLIPLIWLTGSTLKVKTLDKAFYESLQRIKAGFKRVYPTVSSLETSWLTK